MVSCSSSEEAMNIAKTLIDKKLVACAQMSSPITSVYTWKNKLETSQEFMLQLKTLNQYWGEVEKEVRSMHSYEVPEIIAIEVDRVSSSYEEWLNSVLMPINGEGVNE